MGSYGKHSIKHKHSLLRPGLKISVIRNKCSHVIMKLLIYIHKGRRYVNSRLYREAKAMGLSVIVIGILSDYDTLYICQWGKMKGIEDIICRREYLSGGVLLTYKFVKFSIIFFFVFRCQFRRPVIRNCRHNDPSLCHMKFPPVSRYVRIPLPVSPSNFITSCQKVKVHKTL